ncbi:MAG: glycosyltransferase [Verrucomicrobiia bacterium]|jgi:glycosyltransferase involved in cell wall biosynthesis
MSASNPQLSIILPAFNEGGHIFTNVGTVRETFVGKLSFEIVVVDDGSLDNTFAEAERAARQWPEVRAFRQKHNAGKGEALKRGFRESRGERVAFLDADLDIPPSQVGVLMATMDRAGADVVIGSKRHPDSKLDYPWHRKFFSYFYYLLIKLLFDLPLLDTQTGVKLFKRAALADCFPRILVKAFAFDIELLAVLHARGYRIVDAPVVIEFKGRFGMFGLRAIWDILENTLAVFYRLRLLRYYDSYQPKTLPDPLPRVSIIIPVKSDNPMLQQSLQYCLDLDYPDFEIVVLPDEPFTHGDPRVRILPTGPMRPAEKRNRGFREATGSIIAFLDDDAYPLPHWLEEAVGNFSRPEVGAVGGPGLTPADDPLLARVSGRIYEARMVSGNYRYRYVVDRMREVDDFPSCNLIVRKQTLETLGGFGTNYWPGEDTELCLQITKKLNQKIIYDPRIEVFHHRRPSLLRHFKQLASYGLHRGSFVRVFPQTSRRLVYFLPSILSLWLLFGWLTMWLPIVGWLYPCTVLPYLLMAAASGFSTRLPLFLLTFAGIVCSHLAYGLSFIRGLLMPVVDAKHS